MTSSPSSDGGKSAHRMGKWYFGGVASAMAACCTHPLDLVKVRFKKKSFSSHVTQMVSDKKCLRLLKHLNGRTILRTSTYKNVKFLHPSITKINFCERAP